MRRVRVVTGMQEFVGRTGTAVRDESYGRGVWRVTFDEPVWVEGVGHVTNDIWESRGIKTVRPARSAR